MLLDQDLSDMKTARKQFLAKINALKRGVVLGQIQVSVLTIWNHCQCDLGQDLQRKNKQVKLRNYYHQVNFDTDDIYIIPDNPVITVFTLPIITPIHIFVTTGQY